LNKTGKTVVKAVPNPVKQMSKGQLESVYRRRTDNTMAKRKSTKGQTIYKALRRKLKIEQHEPHVKGNVSIRGNP
jgi:hypothetical protein